MTKLISVKLAGNTLLVAYGLLAIFHILLLAQVIPSDSVWGGQVGGSPTTLRTLETISLIATVMFAIVVAAKIDYIKAGRFAKAVNILLWIIFAYSILNTLGNLASADSVEKLIFTPITVVVAVLLLRLAIEK